MLNKELINYKDELYWVYRRVKEQRVKDPSTLREYWLCDIALRSGEDLLFCRHIPDAKIIENENTQSH